ncbi:glycine/D-amino acid oxidase, deaminating [Terriglobus roseus DSM 18391]|uniref:Glycine/D-amino acid oxidase, deaminating n=1 Tax=Terriglobus roseus (strain DSM 18391 / NRRL B-41598 / KBS 63) TaxID=926566 RepID=I3ZKJ7_TERRK|nr:FAD-dependent oxidoreductase [Terriglobus roseus]AFL89765.1 glycine/D-amino acid oxidase, deaminating [Terriglobus roseus DSM 18391]
MHSPDVVIAGAGITGLTCALELQDCGLEVVVLERGTAGREASWAAAGMLAAHDPANPSQLAPLADLSVTLYPTLLDRIDALTGVRVPIETRWTLEAAEGWRHHRAMLPALQGRGFRRLPEQSLDPRKLVPALRAAVDAAGVTVLENTPVRAAYQRGAGISVRTPDGVIQAGAFLDCSGAWSAAASPAKGQMLCVHAPGVFSTGTVGNVVVRTHDVYMVPRLDGSVIIGATVEDADFDRKVYEPEMRHLRAEAAELLPALAEAPEIASWAGLRPDTPDHLPILGQADAHAFVAAGHFRNGVLLAPATAHVMMQMVLGMPTSVDLTPFRPDRFPPVIR